MYVPTIDPTELEVTSCNSVSGLSFVVQNAKVTGRKSAVLLAVGGSPSTTLDSAVVNASYCHFPCSLIDLSCR